MGVFSRKIYTFLDQGFGSVNFSPGPIIIAPVYVSNCWGFANKLEKNNAFMYLYPSTISWLVGSPGARFGSCNPRIGQSEKWSENGYQWNVSPKKSFIDS